MKRLFWLTLFISALALLVPITASANGDGLGIKGSPHDFSDNEGGPTPDPITGLPLAIDESVWNWRGEICRVCHVPHDHNRNEALFNQGLLWNHSLSAKTFTMYAERGGEDLFTSFIDGFFRAEPVGTSKLCLGCHDGTVGVDQFDSHSIEKNGDTSVIFIGDYDGGFQVPGSGISLIGSDKNLSGTHPISIEYNEAADTGLFARGSGFGTGGGTIQDVLDHNNEVQCSTCHDVHNSPNESVPNTHLLRVANNVATGNPSGLCLSCHNK